MIQPPGTAIAAGPAEEPGVPVPRSLGPLPNVRRRGFHRWQRLPLALRLVLVLNGLLLVFYTVLFPNYRGPDEPLHVDLIVATATGHTMPWPAPGTLRVSRGVSAGGFITNGRIPDRHILHSNAAPARGARPSYRDAGGATATRNPNQLVQHPPLYYYLCAAVLSLLPHWQAQPFDRVVALLRLVNVLILLPIPLVLYGIARRLGLTKEVGVAAATIPLAVPELSHIGASVNNDNLLLLFLASSTLVIVSVARGDLRLRTAVLLGVLSGLALLTKGFALYLPLTIGLGYLVAATRASLRRAVLPAATAIAVAFAVGGWWWVRNRVLYGTFQPAGDKLVQPHLVAHTSFGETGIVWLKQFVPLMNVRFWENAGAINTPPWLSIAAGAATALTITGVLLSVGARRPSWPDALLLALPVVCILGIVAFGSWSTWEKVIRPAGMQGRYLFGGLPGLAVLAVAGAGRLLGRRQALLPILVLALAGVMQVISGWLTMRVYWLPEDDAGVSRTFGGLRGLLAWSAWPAPLVLLVMAGVVAAGVGTLLVFVRDVRRARAGLAALTLS